MCRPINEILLLSRRPITIMSIPSNDHQQQPQHPHHHNVNIRNGQQHQQRYDEAPTTDAYNKPQPPPPNVRHIPIFVEGREEPLINRNVEKNGQQQRPTSANDHQLPNSKSSGGIFDRVKNFPTINRMQAPQQQRSSSPHRTGPSNVHRSTSANSPARQQPDQSQQQQQTPRQEPEKHMPQPHPDADSILKIQSIQREVLNLMDQVERFTGSTRKDRQYLYLDEMLTQNLLKLDTIDTEGKEQIKQARREAIKCINKCISVLEAKADTNPPQPAGEQMTHNHQQTTGNHNFHHNIRLNNVGQQHSTK